MIATARLHHTFLMEAMWSRFIPAFQKALAWIEQGEIGPPLSMRADFSGVFPFDPANRVFNKALGGGALLDIVDRVAGGGLEDLGEEAVGIAVKQPRDAGVAGLDLFEVGQVDAQERTALQHAGAREGGQTSMADHPTQRTLAPDQGGLDRLAVLHDDVEPGKGGVAGEVAMLDPVARLVQAGTGDKVTFAQQGGDCSAVFQVER